MASKARRSVSFLLIAVVMVIKGKGINKQLMQKNKIIAGVPVGLIFSSLVK